MNHEQRAAWIKRIVMLLLACGVVAGVWFYPKPTEKAAPAEAPPKVIVSPENGLALVHYHRPQNPDSEKLADILNKVQTKYGKLVTVTRIDISRFPETAKAQGVAKAPHLVFISGTEKVFEFQGLWTQPQVEMKVDEILRGLKRVGKDWLPTVPGMTPASK